MTPRTATLIGLTAILMWSLLAVMTVATGKIPAFQLAAMTFAIGAVTCALTWIGRADAFKALRQPLVAWIVGVGGLFGYHALYFLALRFAPPAEAGLLNYLWPLLIVLFSSLLPGERLAAASHHRRGAGACRHGAAVRRQCQLRGRPGAGPDRGLCRGLRLVDLFGAVAPAQIGADRRGRGLLRGYRAARRARACAGRNHGVAGDGAAMGRDRSARRRPGRRGVLRLGHRHEARRHPRAGSRVLRHAAALDRVPDPRRLRQGQRQHRARRGADRRRRPDRGEGYGFASVD